MEMAYQAERDAQLLRAQELELLAQRRQMQLDLERKRWETELRLDRDTEIINNRLAEAAAENMIREEQHVQRRLNREYARGVNAELEFQLAREYAHNIAQQEDEVRREIINDELRRSRNSRLATFRELDRSRRRSVSPLRREDVDNTIVKSRLESEIEMTRVYDR